MKENFNGRSDFTAALLCSYYSTLQKCGSFEQEDAPKVNSYLCWRTDYYMP